MLVGTKYLFLNRWSTKQKSTAVKTFKNIHRLVWIKEPCSNLGTVFNKKVQSLKNYFEQVKYKYYLMNFVVNLICRFFVDRCPRFKSLFYLLNSASVLFPIVNSLNIKVRIERFFCFYPSLYKKLRRNRSKRFLLFQICYFWEYQLYKFE